MKRHLIYSACIAFFFFLSIGLQAQQQLPIPTEKTSNQLFSTNAVGDIYYGAVPSNSGSKPVLVFIHGYSSSAQTWWENNDMYSKAYYDGYRTAFVSVNPDKSIWANGQMFSGMLNAITAKYGVNKVVVVAHSKGGLDTDAAIVHYGAKSKIERVITLGSPHFGTPLADLAQGSWTWWLGAIFGQYNDATASLQTGAMSYYRSITDKNANNVIPFKTIGAWGYSGSLLVSGWYLNANGGGSGNGGNDGVVTYASTKRPASHVLFSGYGDSRGNLNHFEVAEGSNVWTYIKGQLPSSLSRSQENFEVEPLTNPNAIVRSKSQIIASQTGSETFVIEGNAKNISIEVKQAEYFNSITIKNNTTDLVLKANENQKHISKDMMGAFSQKFEAMNLKPGTYTIETQNPFVAIITPENGIETTLTSDLSNSKFVYKTSELINLQLNISNLPTGIQLANTKINGVIRKTASLNGDVVTTEQAIPFSFKYASKADFKAKITDLLTEGVYNISIDVQNEDFRKSIVTSIAVVDDTKASLDIQNPFELSQNYPNPSNGITSINFIVNKPGNYSLKIYDMFGRLIETKEYSNASKGNYSFEWKSESTLRSGMYIYELSNGTERITKNMMLTK